jgi:branched-chain amino acid transport system ATP-binding protein
MNALEAVRLQKRFGAFTAVRAASLRVEQGEFHGLIGPNGSGKSTFMKCLAGSLTHDGGTISLQGKEVGMLNAASRARAGLSIKFQITSVLGALTLFDNVLLAAQAEQSSLRLLFSKPAAALRDRVLDMLEQFHLAGRAFDRADTLSHGQQQWLEMAMALSTQPKVLLLDEPTAGMSKEERRATGKLLDSLRQKLSIILVEHDLDFVLDICDRVTVLDQGTVLATGTANEIQSNAEVRKVYLRRV